MNQSSLGGLVSVITPAFNAVASLERVVCSVASQSVPVLEHIVIDDGSNDGTAEVLGRLSREFGHLRTIAQPRRGAANARNAGIEVARGRYVTFLDSDDEWRPDKLAHQVGFMEDTGTLFSYGDYWQCRNSDHGDLDVYRTPESLDYSDFLNGCPIGCLTVAYNQEQLGKVYMPEVRRGHDWGLWLALTRDGTVARRYPGIAAIYHVRRGSLSKDKLRKAWDVYRIYRDQERVGRVRSLFLLGRHSWNSLVR